MSSESEQDKKIESETPAGEVSAPIPVEATQTPAGTNREQPETKTEELAPDAGTARTRTIEAGASGTPAGPVTDTGATGGGEASTGGNTSGARSFPKEDLIILLITAIIMTPLGFVVKNEYDSLKIFEAVKWQRENVSPEVLATATSRDEKIFIYKFGPTTLKNVDLVYTIVKPDDYRIVRGQPSDSPLKQYERGILSSFANPNPVDSGREVTEAGETKEDSFRFRFDELSPSLSYELTLRIESRNNQPVGNVGYFELRNERGAQFGNKGLEKTDYLRLYLNGVLVVVLFLLLIPLIFIAFKGVFRLRRRRLP